MTYNWFKWCISDLRSVSDLLNARGSPCTKSYKSSASQWLSGEQVRLRSGHPKVQFGTIVEGSWKGGVGGVGCTVALSGSLTNILKWPGRSRVQTMCNTSSTYHAQHVVCHIVRKDNSATKFDRVKIAFISTLFYWLNYQLMKEGRKLEYPPPSPQPGNPPNPRFLNLITYVLSVSWKC